MNENATKEGLTLIGTRQGSFCGYSIDGRWFEDQGGERSWLIFLVPKRKDPSYWVSGNEFRSALMSVDLSGKAHIQIDDRVTDLDPEVKQVLLSAIQKWESAPESL